MGDSNSKQIFIEFCTNSYPQCLDDYIHLICNHSDNDSLNEIANYFQKNHELNVCLNVNKCQSTRRHCTTRNRMDKEEKYDDNSFYVDLFDTIHFYIYHLEAFGLRVPLKSKQEKDEMNNNHNYLKCTDLRIGAIQKIIENKRKEIGNLNMERLDNTNNSKFNI